MIKEEIIVKTKEDFDREIDKFKFVSVLEVSAIGVVSRTKTYKITDYAAPVDTLVVEAITRHMYYSTGEDNSANRELIVFADGRTSRTNRHNCRDHLSSWRWDNTVKAIAFLHDIAKADVVHYVASADYDRQTISVSYDVEITVRLVEDKLTETVTFERGEKVLVWDFDKGRGELQHFIGYSEDKIRKFACWCDDKTSSTTRGYTETWRHCAKICQKCEKEVCECKAEPTFEEDELVFVWNDDKCHATLRYFKQQLGRYFYCWADGATSSTTLQRNNIRGWKHCAKICQVCEKEVCECKPEPTFEMDELVLVWDDDKYKAVLQYFEGYLDDKCEPYKFNCWVDGATELTAHGFGEMWKHCVKVCQKCGKEECKCK